MEQGKRGADGGILATVVLSLVLEQGEAIDAVESRTFKFR